MRFGRVYTIGIRATSGARVMREVLLEVVAGGWCGRGGVTGAGKSSEDLGPGAWNSVLKRGGLDRGALR